MIPRLNQLAYPLRDRRGIAFPVALLGLVALSVMITGVLLTASTEVTLSSAHKEATRDLYIAQGALEAFIAQQGLALAAGTVANYVPPGASAYEATTITVRQLASVPSTIPGAPANLFFSVEAQPVQGGRTVSVMARVASTVLVLRNAVDAAVVSGSDVRIGGNTTVSDTTDRRLCSPDSAANYAIQVDSTNSLITSGSPTISGDRGKLGSNTDQYLMDMLGTTLTDLKNNATINFARGQFSGNTTVTSFGTNSTTNVANRTNPQLTPYNWGCPADLLRLASANNSNRPCEQDTDTLHYPVIAIDASNSDGSFGAVSMRLEHGQGILVVYNGDLNIQGQLAFKGLVIVEGSFSITGAGNNGARFEGSVIGLGKNSSTSTVTEDPNSTYGTPTIRYNRCAINSVLQVFNTSNSFQRQTPPTTAWSEVVR